MEGSILDFQKELNKLRADRMTPEMVQGLLIDYHGVPSQLKEVASITLENQRTLLIKPWEKKLLTIIERALIQHHREDFVIHSSSELLRLTSPPLTQQRREALVKQLSLKQEARKVKLRAIRQSYREKLKSHEVEDERKNGQERLQKSTDMALKELELIVKKKSAALMEV